ncbi:beta-lactamase family protein [Cytophagales bacterium LB-30]|uniref:Beta-lactamase family protein n=1 Tax=Shiella aurantiaca TaxID=3058365 RepID=A0ABT8F209_9BACT|nr:serine hydrolase [Shiella aurantiaca]MDN4164487.1 beta-lactamase family protein [Shiella aurantiaca]
MKRTLLILITICLAQVVFAQTESYKKAIDNFQANYNAGNYDEIFNSLSPEMQKTLPIDKNRQFLTSLKNQVGEIIGMELVKIEEGTNTLYKTQFERAILGIYITLNDQNKIAGLLIKPYEEPKTIESVSKNELAEYPKEIAEIIFSKTKNLPNNTQLSIAVIENGKVNYFGIVRDNETIRPIENQNQVFEIGSVTKVFTSTVLAALVKNGEIKLTDTINAFYPFDFKDNIKITFESLANHTSGVARLPENLDLSNTDNPYEKYGAKEIEEYLKNSLSINSDPSKSYTYSNLGTGLLGYTLGISQKTTFQDLVQKHVFEKYDMNSSFTSSKNLGNLLVKGMDNQGKAVSNWEFDVLFGCGGILSTTEDLAKFVLAHFDSSNKDLELTRKPTFEIGKDFKIGLGWHILKSKNGNNLYWHNGGTGGYSSSLTMDVENKRAVIILSNVAQANKNIDDLGIELINKMEK